MKIGLVLDDSLDKTDGVQQYVLTLGRWYQQQGHVVHYLVGQTKRHDIAHIHSLSHNLQVHFNQNRMSTPLPANRRRIAQLLTKEQFDVLHVQLPYSPLLAGRIIRTAPKQTAIIGTFHIVPFARLERVATRLLSLWTWRTQRRFDAVVSVSVPAQRFARRGFGLSSTILPNVVNIAALHTGKRLRKFSDGKVNIVFLGRMVERKGCRYFLEALQTLHKDNLLSGVRVLIGGKGPEEANLRKYVEKHRLGKVVRFLGFIPEADKASYLASADLAVFPSLGGESFGIVLIEAMAARSAVVLAGNNIGYRSVMRERPNQLFDPKNRRQFAKSLSYFAFNQPARRRAVAWQEQQVTKYDIARVGPQLVALYEQMIAKRRAKTDNTTHEPTAKS